ncbi:MAG: cofactor-independent phosphoglycerate mutase [Planctomycetota bacterium]
MKYVIVIPDGCADEPLEALAGRTPLQAANLPAMDSIANAGMTGVADNTPANFPAGSEVANLCLLGYDPNLYFTGRAPLEAAAAGIQLGAQDCAIRCNMVTIEDQIMVDFTAGHVSTEESDAILQTLSDELLRPDGPLAGLSGFDSLASRLEFVTGVSYRNLLLVRGDNACPCPITDGTRSRAPHDLTDLPVVDDFPRGPGSDLLVALMNASADSLRQHPVNTKRVEDGKRPVTHIWLWGTGGAPGLPTFQDRFGIRGVMITAVDLLRGIGSLAGFDRIEVDGATGYLDTNYAGKGAAALKAWDEYDLVCVHIEAPDEASHEGRHEAKIEALEQIDRHIVGPIWEKVRGSDDARMLVLPDHPTFCRTKKHTHGPVPFVLAGSGVSSDAADKYDEVTADQVGQNIGDGWLLMDHLIVGS